MPVEVPLVTLVRLKLTPAVVGVGSPLVPGHVVSEGTTVKPSSPVVSTLSGLTASFFCAGASCCMLPEVACGTAWSVSCRANVNLS